MPISMELLSHPTIVELRFVERFSIDEMNSAVAQAAVAARGAGTNLFLANCEQLIPGDDPFDIYALVARFEELGVERTMREALIVPAGTPIEADLSFYETVARNRGYNVRLFHDRASAVAWLSG